MNLYKYLLNNKSRQEKFCEDLIHDFPEIYKWSKNNEKMCYIHHLKYNNKLLVCTARSKESMSCYNIFNIFDKDMKDYPDWGILNKKNLSYGQDYDLEPLVKNWCIKYEKDILRENKLKRILNIKI